MLDPQGGKFNQYAEEYLRCKDRIDELKTKHKEELEPFNDLLTKLKGWLGEHLTQIGVENVKTEHGTIHFIRRRTVTLNDAEAFMDYVISTERWELLDRKANVTAVTDFIKEEGGSPPGAQVNTFTDVSVRRGTGKSD